MLALLLAPAGARAQSQPAPDKDAAVILVVDASKSMKADDGTGRPKIDGGQGGAQHARRRAARRRQGRPARLRLAGQRHRQGGGLRGHEARLAGRAAGPRRAQGRDRRAHAARVHADRRVAAGRGRRTSGPRSRRPSCSSPTAATTARRPRRAASRARSPRAASRCKIQAVGFQVKAGARRQLQCIADAGGGRYVDADNAQELGGQLRALTARALRPYVTEGKRLEAAPAPAHGEALRARASTRPRSAADAPAWFSFKVGAGQTISGQRDAARTVRRRHPGDLQDGDPGREPRVHGQRRRDELRRRR